MLCLGLGSYHYQIYTNLCLADAKGSMSLLDSVVTDIDAGQNWPVIQFTNDNSILVNNVTLTDTHRSMGISVEAVESFTMTHSELSRSETGISFGRK